MKGTGEKRKTRTIETERKINMVAGRGVQGPMRQTKKTNIEDTEITRSKIHTKRHGSSTERSLKEDKRTTKKKTTRASK